MNTFQSAMRYSFVADRLCLFTLSSTLNRANFLSHSNYFGLTCTDLASSLTQSLELSRIW